MTETQVGVALLTPWLAMLALIGLGPTVDRLYRKIVRRRGL